MSFQPAPLTTPNEESPRFPGVTGCDGEIKLCQLACDVRDRGAVATRRFSPILSFVRIKRRAGVPLGTFFDYILTLPRTLILMRQVVPGSAR